MSDTNEIKSKTIKGFFWRLAERVIAQLVKFIVTVVLARILLPNDYGVVALAGVFVTIVTSMAVGGFGAALVQKKDSDDTDFSTIFYVSIVLALVAYTILFFLAPLIAKMYKNDLVCPVLRVSSILLFIFSINSVQQAYVNKKMIFKKFFFATIIGTIVSGIVGIILAYKGFGVWALVVQQLTNAIIDTVVLFIMVRWHPKLVFSWKSFSELFSFGWRMTLTGFVGNLFDKLRNLLIGMKYSPSDLAFYNRGESLPQLITSNINTTLDSVLFPAMSRLQDDKEKLKNAMRRSIKIGTYVLMPLLLGLAGVAHNIVLVLFTEKWIQSVPFVMIVCVGEIPGVINTANLQAIKAVGRSDIMLILEFIKKPLYLTMVLVSVWISPMALAAAHACYGILSLIINTVPNYKLLSYNLFEQICDVIGNLILSLIMGVSVFMLGKIPMNIYFSLLLQVGSGIIIYVLGSIVSRNENFYYIFDMLKSFAAKKGIENVKN